MPFSFVLARIVQEGELAVDRHAGLQLAFRRAQRVDRLVAAAGNVQIVGMVLLHFHGGLGGLAGTFDDRHFVLVPVRPARRAPPQRAATRSTGYPAGQRFDVLQHAGRQLVGVIEAPHGEAIADHADAEQQERAHEDESQHASQHDLDLPHRLGHHGVQRAVADIGRQAQRAEDQRKEHRQVDREVQHHLDIELARVQAVFVDEQGGEEDQDHEHHEDHHHAAAERLADRQPRQGEDAAGRDAGNVDGNLGHGPAALPRARQGPTPPGPRPASCRHKPRPSGPPPPPATYTARRRTSRDPAGASGPRTSGLAT